MNLGELKELWRKTGFRPTKRMGQNFLHDANARKKLLSCLELDDNSVVVEIGPGFGAMTFDIRGKCRKLFVVEKDRKICDIMAPFFFEYPGIELIESDILDVEFARFCERGEKITVYGNIPYNISTPLIEKIISQRDYVKNVYFVMQEEVVDRIVAGPGTKDYGALSCYVQYFTRARKLGRIKKKSFYPVPAVMSSLLKLEILEKPSVDVIDERLFFKIVRGSFSQRRKKAVNPLVRVFPGSIGREECKKMFTVCGIDPDSRAETLSLEDFAALTLEAHRILSLSGEC